MARHYNETQFRKAYEVSEDYCTIYQYIVDSADCSCTQYKTLLHYFYLLDMECRRGLLRYLHEQERTQYLYYLINNLKPIEL